MATLNPKRLLGEVARQRDNLDEIAALKTQIKCKKWILGVVDWVIKFLFFGA